MNMAWMTRGFSDTAEYIDETTKKGRQHLQESNAIGIDPVTAELATVWEECRQPNWDGFEALPISQDALRNAYIFLTEALPLGFPAPSIGAEPDGELTLEWHKSARRTLSVSVSPEGDLHYAALFGPNNTYGTEAFYGELPPTILGLVQRVYSV